MQLLSKKQVVEAVNRFLPESMRENPFVTSLLAGAAAIGILLATPAFAPLGVVGATGWIIVYAVTGGTLGIETIRKIWNVRQHMSEEKRKDVDTRLEILKKMRDDGAIDDEEYKMRSKKILDEFLGT
ncbi:SHOCT domain-containing protein [Desulfonatronum thiodismutans]|uniref:SHOCT domain-containing protein n=1 Tax=Desulfonatronum thiodismutans TaxID=159290 RepID=UPI000A00DAC9|nr:SHOCT domain-containing protein [Desulfonatronum thiodismutans]